jgi:endonuclease YncB( thermonuclease family)
MSGRIYSHNSEVIGEVGAWCMTSRRLWLCVLLLIGLLAPVASATADELVRVKRVFDGDTVLLEDGRRVRYLGINTPESREPYSLKAKRLNESLVLGREVRLECDEERTDTFSRLLAYVYVGDQMVNARLIAEGLAHAFFIGPNRKHNALFLRLQEEAKQGKLGMWSARARPRQLKITSIHRADPKRPEPYAPYVRIANLGSGPIRLGGYVLSSEAGQKYLFPDVSLEPGYTVIVVSTDGIDGVDKRGQLVVHWPGQASVWDSGEDTAFFMDSTGALVDAFHYKGRRQTTSRTRLPRKSP